MFQYIKVRDVKSPVRANKTDSGIDFFIPNDLTQIKITPTDIYNNFEIKEDGWFELIPWRWLLIPSWIKMIIPEWFDLVFDNKSGVASKKHLLVWAKVVDSSYRWEVHLHLINVWTRPIIVYPWDKIVQWILRKVELWEPIEIKEEEFYSNETERGEGWFWSTWTK